MASRHYRRSFCGAHEFISQSHGQGLFGTSIACLNVTQRTIQRYFGPRVSVPATRGRLQACMPFNGIDPNTQCAQLASAIAQQAQQMPDGLPDQGRKAPSLRTRRHAYGILRSADSSAL